MNCCIFASLLLCYPLCSRVCAFFHAVFQIKQNGHPGDQHHLAMCWTIRLACHNAWFRQLIQFCFVFLQRLPYSLKQRLCRQCQVLPRYLPRTRVVWLRLSRQLLCARRQRYYNSFIIYLMLGNMVVLLSFLCLFFISPLASRCRRAYDSYKVAVHFSLLEGVLGFCLKLWTDSGPASRWTYVFYAVSNRMINVVEINDISGDFSVLNLFPSSNRTVIYDCLLPNFMFKEPSMTTSNTVGFREASVDWWSINSIVNCYLYVERCFCGHTHNLVVYSTFVKIRSGVRVPITWPQTSVTAMSGPWVPQ